MKTRKMTRAEKVIIYVLGSIDEKRPVSNEKRPVMVRKGRKMYKKLVKKGFRPTQQEISSCLDYLHSREMESVSN